MLVPLNVFLPFFRRVWLAFLAVTLLSGVQPVWAGACPEDWDVPFNRPSWPNDDEINGGTMRGTSPTRMSSNTAESNPSPRDLMSGAFDDQGHSGVRLRDFLAGRRATNNLTGIGVIVEKSRAAGSDASSRFHMTATLVAKNRILTVNHGISSKAILAHWVFALGWYVYRTQDGKATFEAPSPLQCFRVSAAQIIASAPGDLDYTLLEISKDEHGKLPFDYGFKPPRLAVEGGLPSRGERVHLIGGANGITQAPEGMIVAEKLIVRNAARYTKDLGTAVPLDYDGNAWSGLSGAPIVNDDLDWLGIHQRNLNNAYCDQQTMWHPYNTEKYESYVQRYAYVTLAEICALGKGIFEGWRGKPPMAVLPNQGTLLVDIAYDVLQRTRIEWLCEHLPTFVKLLAKVPAHSCDRAVRATSERAAEAGSAGNDGAASTGESGSDR